MNFEHLPFPQHKRIVRSDKMTVKRLAVFLKCCLIIPLLSGCWSKIEVNDIAIVTALGLDQTESGNIILSLEVAIPRMLGVSSQSSEKIETKAGWILTAEGTTILEAYQFIQQKLPRRIAFYHSKVIVIGERLARSGVLPVLDFFERYNQSLIRSHVLFAKGEALEILEFKPTLEKLASEVMREEAKSQISVSIRLLQFMDMLMSEGDSAVAARVQLMPAEAGSLGKETRIHESDTMSLSIKGAAVFKQDKLIGWLNEKEAKGLMWLKNRMDEGIVTVQIPEEKGGGLISSRVETTHNKIRPKLGKDPIAIHIDQYADIAIYENSSKLDLGNPNDVTYAKTLIENDIKARIEAIANKARKQFKSDIMGFGRVVYRFHPAEWEKTYAKNWEERFPELEIVIRPHVTVSQVGLTNKSIPIK
ncbi:Ger(x)C family spore germination protein [Paenibacillaceae bacterium]|nr:Ger(x)C family spore germination protein [Paenibacillaceae bacterium]